MICNETDHDRNGVVGCLDGLAGHDFMFERRSRRYECVYCAGTYEGSDEPITEGSNDIMSWRDRNL